MLVWNALLTGALLLAGCGGGKLLIPGRIMVSFDPDVTESAATRIIENNGLGVSGGICVKPGITVPFSAKSVTLEAAVPYGEEDLWRSRLKRIPGVTDAKPCYEKIKQ